jgi:hypothetical protein
MSLCPRVLFRACACFVRVTGSGVVAV